MFLILQRILSLPVSFGTIKVLLILLFVSAELQPDHVVLIHTGFLHHRAECEYPCLITIAADNANDNNTFGSSVTI